MDELVDLYKVAPSTKLEENSIFYVIENTYVHVDVDKLNDILSTYGYIEIDEVEEIEQLWFNKKDDDGHKVDENEKKEESN